MIEYDDASVAQLAQSLSRARTGDGTNAEVVQWLRAVSGMARSIPVPQARDARRSYGRTLLHRCEEFEILVLHWLPGARSSIHDHGGALCWLAVAQGEVGVENYLRYDTGATPGYARIGFEGRAVLETGSIDYRQDDVHLHRCFAGDEHAVSLHVYARPIERFYTFDERAETCCEATSTYDAILGASRA